MNTSILQAEAAVKFHQNLLPSGRTTKAKLAAAIEHLESLKLAEESKAATIKNEPKAILPVSDNKNTQLELSIKAADLRKKQADLSNSLHLIPTDQNCLGLVTQILSLGDDIENIWTQKKNIDRNGSIDVSNEEKTDRPPESLQRLSVIHSELQKAYQKVSKLKGKLADKGAKNSTKAKWTDEMARTEMIIKELKNERDNI